MNVIFPSHIDCLMRSFWKKNLNKYENDIGNLINQECVMITKSLQLGLQDFSMQAFLIIMHIQVVY